MGKQKRIAKGWPFFSIGVVASFFLVAFSKICLGDGTVITPVEPDSQEVNKVIFENDGLSLGLTYVGGGIRWGFQKGWSVEGRYVTGQEGSAGGTVKAQFLCARAAKHWMSGHRWAPYGAIEGGTLRAADSSRKASGTAFGLVGGIEFAMTRKLSITFEMGPYSIGLKDKVGGIGGQGTDIVLGSTFYWHLFQ